MFIYTRHALEKMDALGIERREIEQTIMQGMKWKEQQNEKWHARMAGIEAIFMKQQDDFVIITAYLAGGPR